MHCNMKRITITEAIEQGKWAEYDAYCKYRSEAIRRGIAATKKLSTAVVFIPIK